MPLYIRDQNTGGLVDLFSNDVIYIRDQSTGELVELTLNGLQPARFITVYEDYLGTDGGVLPGVATGGAIAYNVTSDSQHPGITQASTSNSSSGLVSFGIGGTVGLSAVCFGGGAWVYETVLRIPTLSTGSETFLVIGGFNDNRANTGTDMVAFRYTHGTNSGKWEVVTRANGAETATDTTIAVTANQWYKLRIEVAANASSVAFYIDGTLRATNTTNIPSGTGRETGIHTGIIKQVGTTARTMDVDYIYYSNELTTTR